MKSFVIIFLAIFGFIRASDDVCAGLSDACINILLKSLIFDDSTEEEACRGIRNAIECLETAVDDCLNDEDREDLREGVRELESLQAEHCEKSTIRKNYYPPAVEQRFSQQEVDDISKCLEENSVYIHNCVYDGSANAMSILDEDASEDLMKCAIYGMMAGCYVGRVGEKCGDRAAELADKEFVKTPPEVESSCEAAGGIKTYSFHFPDYKRKK